LRGTPVVIALTPAGRWFYGISAPGRVVRQMFGGPRALFLVKLDVPLSLDYVDKKVLSNELKLRNVILPKYRAQHTFTNQAKAWMKFFEYREREGFLDASGHVAYVWGRWADITLNVPLSKLRQPVEIAFIAEAASGAGKVPVLTGRLLGWKERYTGYGIVHIRGVRERHRRPIAIIELSEPIHISDLWSIAHAVEAEEHPVAYAAIQQHYFLPNVYTLAAPTAATIKRMAKGWEGAFYEVHTKHAGRKLTDKDWPINIAAFGERLQAFARGFLRRWPLKPHKVEIGSRPPIPGPYYYEFAGPVPRAQLRKALARWFYLHKEFVHPWHRETRAEKRTAARGAWKEANNEVVWNSMLWIIPINYREADAVAVRPMREDLAEYLEIGAVEATRGVR